ncbi:biopolymer transporter ExbD [bacterium]|nr:biopolymer transporter ExbD [bacterium]
MGRIKKKRIGIRLDMTPMVDVAFLLLTFFMLTTTFRPPEEVQVNVPDSHSELKLPSANVITLSVTKEKTIWMNVDAQTVRAQVFGLDYAKRAGKEVTLEELPELIRRAQLENMAIRGAKEIMQVIVKADRDADYDVISDILDILQAAKITTVNFATNLEK